MIYQALAQFIALLLDLFTTKLCSPQQKDLEILLLRQQLRILQRRHPQALQLSRWSKLGLAVLAAKLTALGRGTKTVLQQALVLFKPDTVLKWHRELVRRKWSFANIPKKGRPAIDLQLQELLLQLARENPRWGHSRVHGELLKLSYTIGRSTMRGILKRQHIAPAPERVKQGASWSNLRGHYGQQILATDFFTVETALLKTLHALFFIEVGSRRVHFAGCTDRSTADWVAQQARQLTWTLQDEHKSMRFLIHDRDAKLAGNFDNVFAAEGIEILRTP